MTDPCSLRTGIHRVPYCVGVIVKHARRRWLHVDVIIILLSIKPYIYGQTNYMLIVILTT